MKIELRNWCVVAIDPGTSPTICAMWDRGESLRWYDAEHTGGNYRAELHRKQRIKSAKQPDPDRIRHILEYHNPDLVVIEKVWVRPTKEYKRGDRTVRGQGVVSQARLVASAYLCDGVASGLRRNILRIFPQTWMKHHGLITRNKAFHRQLASTLAPQWSWAFARVQDHDRADAYLMARVGHDFLDTAYARAVRRGAPLDHVPIVNAVR